MSTYHSCRAGVPPLALAETPAVRLQQTGALFNTLGEAIAAAQSAGLSAFALEVIGDVTETSDVVIASEVTIAAQGEHSVRMMAAAPPLRFTVQGGSLTLGDGSAANTLQVFTAITVTEGMLHLRQGAAVSYAGNAALHLSGPAALGLISGGSVQGGAIALRLDNGAQISEISGGSFFAAEDAAFLSGTGTRVNLISGGSFYQTDPVVTLHGHALFVDNSAQVDQISGGYFEAQRSNALAITRGGWVGELSGGEFFAARAGSAAGNDRNATVRIAGIDTLSGMGLISGGYFHGGYFALLLVRIDAPAQIERITGGSFTGVGVALQNDLGCAIAELSGGVFTANQGMLNNGTIGHIGGSADFHGTAAANGYGLYNYNSGQIGEISGGSILSDSSNGVMNAGLISLISGGTIVGGLAAVSCTGINPGRLSTISGGTFWGKNDAAILLAFGLSLEPGLSTLMGLGRYWGAGGVVFQNDSLVTYPYNDQYQAEYHLSTQTVTVDGLPGAQFRYLELNAPFFDVMVFGSFAPVTGAGRYVQGEQVHIDAGSRAGFVFAGWAVQPGDLGLADPASPATAFVMPGSDVTLTARWSPLPHQLSITGSFAEDSGAGLYPPGATVTIHAGSRTGYRFDGWTVTSGGVVLADPASPVTSFVMPENDVTLTANWTPNPSAFLVTILGSFAALSGAGSYAPGDTVTIRAGSRACCTFAGWTVNAGGAELTEPASPVTSFVMPESDVTLTAHWTTRQFTVTFVDWDGSILSVQQVDFGSDAVPPAVLPRPGFAFTGWLPSYTDVQSDLTVTAQYEALPYPPAQLKLRAKKRLRGAALQEGMFSFALLDQDGNELTRAVNDACGNICFSLELFYPPGCYRFTIKEIPSPQSPCAFDRRCFPALVSVCEPAPGRFSAQVRYPLGLPVFVNSHRPPC